MAKPDNRSDNVEKLQRSIQNTIKNFREGQDYLSEHADEISPQEKKQIEEKNEKRLHAIEGLREEIKDEAAHQRKS
ncbi:small acid-soluble spore protein Tlp [Paenibacillus phoenicis]|uniref:Small acid-soluble spore protein Tlp n=1 Tax=Paenibacillus phoenicis TaxID=554117 RepID=A0ABU5PJU6_9BACL|nr:MULTISPECIES: small acid-soluble spore protein Tlp [Paenibacillus]EES72274.1 small, acid-soluble spore protein tlp [Paenibacillus sp. oral taxon 786 str. D14]MCT2196238.1 small acid-soluble spore protein Tlp [Paenibacillus sp. p3-SID1389]MEA3569947.1 small acid-soluble spore protein Tlp [Paenibacillus phoenicis]